MDKDQIFLTVTAAVLLTTGLVMHVNDCIRKNKNEKLEKKRANGRFVWAMYKASNKPA